LVGSGAKALDWFEFGPEELFPGNCWSAIGLHEPNHTTFAYIAEASRMVAEVEDLLIQGAMPASDVAVLYPRSAFLWDEASNCTCASSQIRKEPLRSIVSFSHFL
jgi:hypothetical protein